MPTAGRSAPRVPVRSGRGSPSQATGMSRKSPPLARSRRTSGRAGAPPRYPSTSVPSGGRVRAHSQSADVKNPAGGRVDGIGPRRLAVRIRRLRRADRLPVAAADEADARTLADHPDSHETSWNMRDAASGYLFANQSDYVQPTTAADHGPDACLRRSQPVWGSLSAEGRSTQHPPVDLATGEQIHPRPAPSPKWTSAAKRA